MLFQKTKNETLVHFNIKKEINVISNFIDYSLYEQSQTKIKKQFYQMMNYYNSYIKF